MGEQRHQSPSGSTCHLRRIFCVCRPGKDHFGRSSRLQARPAVTIHAHRACCATSAVAIGALGLGTQSTIQSPLAQDMPTASSLSCTPCSRSHVAWAPWTLRWYLAIDAGMSALVRQVSRRGWALRATDHHLRGCSLPNVAHQHTRLPRSLTLRRGGSEHQPLGARHSRATLPHLGNGYTSRGTVSLSKP